MPDLVWESPGIVQQSEVGDLLMKKGFGLILSGVYVLSTVFFCDSDNLGIDIDINMGKVGMTASDFGVMCISSSYPALNFQLADSRDNEIPSSDGGTGNGAGGSFGGGTDAQPVDDEEKPEPVVFGDEPAVLIVHTHATESYLPASEGNYHTKKKENTVRDVGSVLAQTLKDEGIMSVHDLTLHDNPSYSQSYSRSYDTVEALLKKYPTIKCVIDLHRDAIASDSKAQTVSVGGRQCAAYSFVVSNAVPTYDANLKFIKRLNKEASGSYSGFCGKVLERGYRYNQDLSSHYMLLEIGYNRNDIEEARNTAEVFGKVLADTLKAGY